MLPGSSAGFQWLTIVFKGHKGLVQFEVCLWVLIIMCLWLTVKGGLGCLKVMTTSSGNSSALVSPTRFIRGFGRDGPREEGDALRPAGHQESHA